MCSNESPPPSSTAAAAAAAPPLPYKMMQMQPQPLVQPSPAAMPVDQYRLQLYNYAVQAERLRAQQWPLPVCPGYGGLGLGLSYHPRLALSMSLFNHRVGVLQPEEPKPQHSYIGLIAMAILSSPDTKLVLSDIYQYILDNYPYFRSRGPGWRNSIRHNLSLNDCFVKAGRSANGKGHYWAIHPANVEDFKKGDFRRRKAQRKVRKHMGLAVDDDGNDSPSPPPMTLTPPPALWPPAPIVFPATFAAGLPLPRKRPFDVASLLAPDDDPVKKRLTLTPCSSDEEDIDVVSSDQAATPSPSAPSRSSPQAPWPLRPLGLPDQHQAIVRYYEQLAAQQSARRAAALHVHTLRRSPSPSPPHHHHDHNS